MATSSSVITISSSDPERLMSLLDSAVDSALAEAMTAGKHSVMVTYHDHSTISVSVTTGGPSGLALEQECPIQKTPPATVKDPAGSPGPADDRLATGPGAVVSGPPKGSHRIVDGADASRFLSSIRKYIEAVEPDA